MHPDENLNPSAEDLLSQYGQYDPKLDLSGYQYPTLDLLPDLLHPILQQAGNKRPKYGIRLMLDAKDSLLTRDLYHHPNVLLAGTIASGKTQFIYNQIISWLYTYHPAELKLVICRSKPVDYNSIVKIERHFLSRLPSRESSISQGGDVLPTVNGLLLECEQRLSLFQSAGVKTIADYNDLFIHRSLNPEQGHRYLPNIVLVMDDLQTFLEEETTKSLISLTQQNLYTGIYLIAATSQIMSRSITPQLRANFSVRLAMKLMSQNESRKILDRVGAEKLNPPGELLHEQGEKLVKGMQPFIDYKTIQTICEFVGSQRGYPSAHLLPESVIGHTDFLDFDPLDRDSMFEDAARLIVMHQQGSISLIQRKLKLGYNRAGRIIDQLEAAGIVGPFEGSHTREVLYPDEYSLEQYLTTLGSDDDRGISTPRLRLNTPVSKENKITAPPKQKTPPPLQTEINVEKYKFNTATSATNNTSKIQAYLVVGILVGIVALMIFFLGGWEGLLKWMK